MRAQRRRKRTNGKTHNTMEEKKVLITISENGQWSVTAQGIPTMPELIGILETAKCMKVNDALGIRPAAPQAPAHGLLLPKKKGILE